jgi:aspartyl-tRNA synthetase
MVKAFEIVGLTKADVEERFGGLYRAFQYGAPPHGGMAAGVDRIVMLLCGAQNLREITLFPMNQRAEDLLMGAPLRPSPSSCGNSTFALSSSPRAERRRIPTGARVPRLKGQDAPASCQRFNSLLGRC